MVWFSEVSLYVMSWLPTVHIILVTLWICNWVLYAILLLLIDYLEQPPRVLRRAAELMDMIFEPWSYGLGWELPLEFWPVPFSPWVMTVLVFVLWALPDCIVELSADLF